jgi:hypothetical protein
VAAGAKTVIELNPILLPFHQSLTAGTNFLPCHSNNMTSLKISIQWSTIIAPSDLDGISGT